MSNAGTEIQKFLHKTFAEIASLLSQKKITNHVILHIYIYIDIDMYIKIKQCMHLLMETLCPPYLNASNSYNKKTPLHPV